MSAIKSLPTCSYNHNKQGHLLRRTVQKHKKEDTCGADDDAHNILKQPTLTIKFPLQLVFFKKEVNLNQLNDIVIVTEFSNTTLMLK